MLDGEMEGESDLYNRGCLQPRITYDRSRCVQGEVAAQSGFARDISGETAAVCKCASDIEVRFGL